MTTRRLIEYVLENVPLTKKPGTAWIYSNFGYQLLGYIIERKTGMTYEEFVKQNIWTPIGVKDVCVAGPTISDKAPYVTFFLLCIFLNETDCICNSTRALPSESFFLCSDHR